MSQLQWEQCRDPIALLTARRGQLSNRKLRLFAVECCHRIVHLLDDERSLKAIGIAERYADALATEDELAHARTNAIEAARVDSAPLFWARHAASLVVLPLYEARSWTESAISVAESASYAVAEAVGKMPYVQMQLVEQSHQLSASGYQLVSIRHSRRPVWVADEALMERIVQSSLIDDLAHYPLDNTLQAQFDRVPDASLLALAQQIDNHRSFELMPLFADLLEDLNYYDRRLVTHCRTQERHIRGCWVVDGILRKG